MLSPVVSDYQQAPTATGQVRFDNGWYLLHIEPETFADILARVKFPAGVTTTDSPHISIIKDEHPSLKQPKWGKAFVNERITFAYIPEADDQNGRHLWVNCYSVRLCEMREYFAVPTVKQDGVYRVNFHLTLGKLEMPVEPTLRPQLRLTPFTHIDFETLMQHL